MKIFNIHEENDTGGQREDIVGRIIALHISNTCPIPITTYDPIKPP